MPTTGDSYTIPLKKAHLEWGNHRHTSSRDVIYGEGYLPIPIEIARKFNITNSNAPHNTIYKCSSKDGFLIAENLLAAGSIKAGDIYAKQFEGKGDLQLLGDWFNYINAQIGDVIVITWASPNEIEITKL